MPRVNGVSDNGIVTMRVNGVVVGDGNAGPTGPAGPIGPEGPQGPIGPSVVPVPEDPADDGKVATAGGGAVTWQTP